MILHPWTKWFWSVLCELHSMNCNSRCLSILWRWLVFVYSIQLCSMSKIWFQKWPLFLKIFKLITLYIKCRIEISINYFNKNIATLYRYPEKPNLYNVMLTELIYLRIFSNSPHFIQVFCIFIVACSAQFGMNKVLLQTHKRKSRDSIDRAIELVPHFQSNDFHKSYPTKIWPVVEKTLELYLVKPTFWSVYSVANLIVTQVTRLSKIRNTFDR